MASVPIRLPHGMKPSDVSRAFDMLQDQINALESRVCHYEDAFRQALRMLGMTRSELTSTFDSLESTRAIAKSATSEVKQRRVQATNMQERLSQAETERDSLRV